MNKKIILILIIIFILVIAGGYLYFTKNITEENTPEPEQKTEEPISNEPLFTKDTLPKIDAVLALHPLATAFTIAFTGEDISTGELGYTSTRSADVYERLINGDVDLILASNIPEESKELAKQSGMELEIIPFAKEGGVFYLNSENPIENLTLEQIRSIYSGEITNWKEVGRK